jgi:response regulator NasT
MDVERYLSANTQTGFMFLSAFNDTATIEEAKRLGALGYLVKPLDVKQIVPAVNAALAQTASAVPAAAAVGMGRGQRDEQVAVGILMERLRMDYDRALDALRNQARLEGASVEALSSSMVEAANRLNSIPR